MIWIAMLIGTLMIADGLFAITNKDFVEEQMSMLMPTKINISKMAFIEFLIGLCIVFSGAYAQIKL